MACFNTFDYACVIVLAATAGWMIRVIVEKLTCQ